MLSAEQNPSVVEQYLQKEREAGRIVGPLPHPIVGLQISRFGVIPKPHQPGKWRLIVDLSHPKGASVNDGIDPALCSLVYTSVDEAVDRIIQRGHKALLAKLDIARSPVGGHDLERADPCGHGAPVWVEIGPENIQRRGRCPYVGAVRGGGVFGPALPGRFPVCGIPAVEGMRKFPQAGS